MGIGPVKMAALLIMRSLWHTSRRLSAGGTSAGGASVPISDECFESLPSSLLSKVRKRLGVRTPTEIQRKVQLPCTPHCHTHVELLQTHE